MPYRPFWADTATLLNVYITCVRPCLEYACTLWDPYTYKTIFMLESVQKFACKVGLKRRDLDYDSMLHLLWCSFPPRYGGLLCNDTLTADWVLVLKYLEIIDLIVTVKTDRFVISTVIGNLHGRWAVQGKDFLQNWAVIMLNVLEATATRILYFLQYSAELFFLPLV